MKVPTITAAIAIAAACTASAFGADPTIDFSYTSNVLTHRATGFLHSFTPTTPGNDMIAPLKPQLFRDWPHGGDGGGAFENYDRATALGAKMQIVVSDGFNNYSGPFPGDNGDYTAWDQYVLNLTLQAKTQGKAFQYDIWNEPDIGYFWPRDASQYLEAWKHAYTDIRLLDPTATIVGPSLSFFDNTKINFRDFLLYAKTNNVLPDVLSWHEFDPRNIVSHVQTVRDWMSANSININRISLNEIVGSGHQNRPGALPQYFAALERADVESATHACWDEPSGINNGNNQSLDGLLTNDTHQPRATWWTYQRYGQMSGTVVNVTAGNTIDGIATKQDGKAEILIGRFPITTATPIQVQLSNLDQVPNLVNQNYVHLHAERIAYNDYNASPGPVTTIDTMMSTTGGVLLPLADMGNRDAYYLTLTAVSTWKNDSDGDWSDGSRWLSGAPTGTGAAARFGSSITAARNVTVSSPQTIGLLMLDSDQSYRISSSGAGSLTFDGGDTAGEITVLRGSHELAASMKFVTSPALSVSDAATLRLRSSSVLRASSLNLNSAGTLDVGSGSTIVDYSGASPAAAIRAKIMAGRGAPGIGNATWNGAGINSATAAANDGISYGIGYAENALLPLGPYSNFAGQTVDSSSVLVKYTRGADANLDGVIDDNDVTIVAVEYMQPGSGEWYLGDFDYSGMCDDNDVTVLAALYDQSAPPLSSDYLSATYGEQFAAAWDRGLELRATLPEPALMWFVGAAGLRRRRRRRLRSL